MEESADMAKTAIVYKNVADGLDSVEESTDSIISTMKAFGIQSDDTMGIVDRFNEVGNNFAITSAGIGEALQRSASALYASGNTIDESIALVTAANSVIQNPEQVGTALKTLSLRLRGAKVELEQAGLETDNMAESTSTLQAKLKALTHGKVDIMLDADTFKSTTQILREMSQAWEDMTDIERAAALELMGGKRQANILASVITNFETVEDVIETSMNSSGSAVAENEKYLNSIQGRLDQFSNSLQTFWNNMINSNVIKEFVEFGTDTIQFLDTVPGKIAAIVVALGAFAKFKGINFFNLKSDISNRVGDYSRTISQLNALKSLKLDLGSADTEWNTTAINAYANSVKSLTANEQAEMLMKQGLNKAQITEIMTRAGVKDEVIQETLSKKNLAGTTMMLQKKTVAQVITTDMATNASQKAAIAAYLEANGHKTLTKELLDEMRAKKMINDEQYIQNLNNISGSWKSMLKNIASSPGVIMMAGTAIAGLINKIKTAKDATEELKEEYSSLESSISTTEDEINTLNSQLEEVQGKIDELSGKESLSLADAEQLNLLKQQAAELEHQKTIQEKILAAREQQEDVKSLQMINNLIKTNAAEQQKAADDSAAAWKVALGIVGAVGAGIAGFYTGGATWAAIPTILGFAAGGAAIGAAAGEKIGYSVGLNSKEAGDSLIEWYESYEAAITKAEQEASEAESTYMSDMTDEKYEKWREKVDALNTIQTEFYDNLAELQGYVSKLEYDDSTSGIIDEYNELIAHLEVKSMGGDISAQLSSIESLKEEFYELSRGVDEHGNNVSLSAEEYARYNTIVSQVLGYNSGLTKGFNETGEAVLRAGDNVYSFNQLLSQTTSQLRAQNIAAAQNATSNENLANALSSMQEAYKNTVSNLPSNHPMALGVSSSKNPHNAWGGKANWGTNDVAEEISYVIGVDFDLGFGDPIKYVKNNIDLIQKNRDKITEQLTETMGELGLNEDTKQKYIQDVETWLDGIYEGAAEAKQNIIPELQKVFQIIPEASEQYYNLSGTSLKFLNEYSSAIAEGITPNLDNLTDENIKAVKDHILEVTNALGSFPKAQEILEDIFTFDAASLPVDSYYSTIRDMFGDFQDELGVAIDARNGGSQLYEVYKSLFISQDHIKKMKEDVSKKLSEAAQGLVGDLSVEELEIAYKIVPELPDNMTFAQLREAIQKHLPKVDNPVQTYSALVEYVDQCNEVLNQTSEIVLNNTKVTQEYKDSLVGLGITEEELAECFDATNGLIVTNADKLNDLVKGTRANVAQNTRLAKSQAILKYYDLYKEMQTYISASGMVVSGCKEQVISLYQEMNALEKTIARYSMLETQLLGVVNAYDKFEQAQQVDSETDYISNVEDMALALGQAFNTAELGTETAQAAIAGLVPESVYEGLDTLDAKMAAIYKYFKDGKIAQYFTLEYDDDGSITSAEMKLGNLRKFIEDGLGADVFNGKDWQHFTFADGFLAELDALPDKADKLEYFAYRMGVTKEVAFAFIKTLEDHDIEWLNGDYSSMFDNLIPETLETQIYGAMQNITDLNAQLAQGKISAEEYAEQFGKLNAEYEAAKQASKENLFGADGVADGNFADIDGYLEANKKVEDAQKNVTDATNALNKAIEALNAAKAEGKTGEGLKTYQETVENATQSVIGYETALMNAIKAREKFETPTETEIKIVMDDIATAIEEAGGKFDTAIAQYFDLNEAGYYVLKVDVDTSKLEQDFPGIQQYVDLLNSQIELDAYANTSEAEVTLETLSGQIDELITTLQEIKLELSPDSVASFGEQLAGLCQPRTIPIFFELFGNKNTDNSNTSESVTGDGYRRRQTNGSGRAFGSAYASGDWSIPTSEHNSLVGELGPEMVVNPYTGRYYTVGDNGAEMVDLPKGAIIFNHKQTEGLLKNGHIASRGRAYAQGNAHVTIYPTGSSTQQWEGTGYSGPNDSTYDLSDTLSNASDAASEFEETLDWVEIRLEEINEQLDLMDAKLENASSYTSKNSIIDQMIGVNETKMTNLTAGIKKYSDYAAKLLADVPAQYREAAQNGAISITEFTGEADEKTVEAINNYREWAQKVADLNKQLEETKTEIRDLAIQKFDNVYEAGDVKATVEDSQTKKLQNAVDYDEERGLISSDAYYIAMMENSNKKIEYLTSTRNAMQKELDRAVKSGEITKYSNEWYELVNQMYEVDAEIDESTIELEEYQNAINDIHWDNFDELINRLDYLSDETQNLIDLMEDCEDVVDENGDWTDEGVTALGLYAQQMEIAEYTAKQYAEAIDDLNRDYKLGKYSESEYLEKLNELKDAQYDSIQAYYEAQDAIVDLNKTRVDAIKDGIQKEIDAYEELIKKKQEELSAEKSLYDFQQSVADQHKNIADIERKLAALSVDHSASATAKKRQLEAELAEARAQLEESYYDRSVENQQNALDKELEDYKNQKDAQIEELDEYLDNVEQVVADSLTTVQANASTVYDTLADKANEYNLTLSDSILTPWRDGALAVSDYQSSFDIAMSSTTAQLDELKGKWQAVVDTMALAGAVNVAAINKENATYVAATKEEPKPTTTNKPSNTNNTNQTKAPPSVGSTVKVKKSATHFSKQSGNAKMASFVPGGSYKVMQVGVNGDKSQILIGKNGKYTGWVWLKDLEGYAKGTTGVDKDQLAWLDELGEELVLNAGPDGRLQYLTKGTSVIPHDLTERLMDLAMNPQAVLDRNRPEIAPSKSVVNNNTEFSVDASVGTLVHVEHLDGNNPEEVVKIVDKAWDKKMQGLNNAIKKFTR